MQLTPETIKDLGSEQIYEVRDNSMHEFPLLEQAPQYTRSQSLSQFMQMYQMYVKELSVLLSEGVTGPEPGSESAQQLEVLVKDLVSTNGNTTGSNALACLYIYTIMYHLIGLQ